MWPVQSQEWKVEFFIPQATNGGGRRVPWRRQCGVGVAKSVREWFSIAVGVVLMTAYDRQKRSETISFEVRSIGIDQKWSVQASLSTRKSYDNSKVVMSCDFRSHYPGPSLPPSPCQKG